METACILEHSFLRHFLSPYSLRLILVTRLTITQHTLAVPVVSPPLAHDLVRPVAQPVAPVPSHEGAAHHVNNLDEEDEEAVALLGDVEQDWLDVVLEEDTGNDALIDLVALLRHGELIRDNRRGYTRVGVSEAIDGGHDGHEVLELVEVALGRVDRRVEGVDEGRIEGAEGEFVDDMGEVESCAGGLACYHHSTKLEGASLV